MVVAQMLHDQVGTGSYPATAEPFFLFLSCQCVYLNRHIAKVQHY